MFEDNNELKQTKEYKMLVSDLVTNRHKAELLRISEATALEAAVKAIKHYHGETQDCRILSYIARNAKHIYIFRDEYTMRALRAGLVALQRREEEMERQCKKTNSQYKDACRPSMTT